MAAEKGRVFTGARARVSAQGKQIGYAKNVSGRESLQYEAIRGLGSLRVLEHAPVGYVVDFTMAWTRLVGETMKKLGLFPKVGKNAEEHLANVLASGEIAITVEDVKTNTVVKAIEQCVCSDVSFSFDAGGAVIENTSWMGIVMRDEADE